MLKNIKIKDDLKKVEKEISKKIPNSKVILFGSYARGEEKEDSDVDLCIIVPEIEGRRLDMKVELRGIIKESIETSLDLILYTHDEFEKYTRLKSTLHYQIKKDGVLING